MKRKHELIEKPYIEICENVPINSNEEIITTTPSSNCTSSDSSSIDVAEDFEEYQNLNQTRNNIENSHKKQRIAHNLAVNLSLNDIDIVEVGENLLTGVNERTIESNRSLQRTQKNFQSQNPTIGNIDLCRLVTNLMCHDAVDVRYAIAGTSFMWNSLKSNVQNMNSLKYSMNTNFSDMLEPEFDLDIRNVKYKTQFTINPKENFVGLDLCYVFTNITFRDNSRFLNKVKQFLKTYFSVACNPKCLIWRFNVRRSGTCHKKTILNLPSRILDVLIDFLLTLTGVGSHSVSPTNVCRGTPFYISLGQNEQERNEVFTKIVHCRDDLIVFFRNAIIDCLNEIREMPFCLSTGRLISPLRGRKMQRSIITWKQYEQYLKEEIENPTDINVKRRTQFEEKMYQAADCEIRVLR